MRAKIKKHLHLAQRDFAAADNKTVLPLYI
jgi:hypothetical protein